MEHEWLTATGVILVARSLVGSRGSFLSNYWLMAGKALLQTLCTPSPLALAASAALHAWDGEGNVSTRARFAVAGAVL